MLCFRRICLVFFFLHFETFFPSFCSYCKWPECITPKIQKLFTLQSFTHPYTHSHTNGGKLCCSQSCPGADWPRWGFHTPVSQDPQTITKSRQVRQIVLPKDTRIRQTEGFNSATHWFQNNFPSHTDTDVMIFIVLEWEKEAQKKHFKKSTFLWVFMVFDCLMPAHTLYFQKHYAACILTFLKINRCFVSMF